MNLITSYFQSDNSDRNKELQECLERNIDNKAFTSITVLVDNFLGTTNERMIQIRRRPTFDAFFHFAKEGQWNVICNSDIFFDETIELLKNRNQNEFVALCRYDIDKNGKPVFFNRVDSQDTWCFFGKPRPMLRADFMQGIPGCDNVLARIAGEAGYKVTNPSLTIKTYHLHNSGQRDYGDKDRLMPPYKLLTPTK